MGRRQTTSDEEIAHGLFVLAAHGENSVKAEKATGISRQKLNGWRTTYPDRYVRIREEHLREIEAGLVAQFRDNAILSTELQRQATMRALEQAEDNTLKNPAQAAQQAAVAAGLAADKLLVLTDRPTAIIEHKDPAAQINQLAQRLGIEIVDSTAEEITETRDSSETQDSSSEPAALEPPPAPRRRRLQREGVAWTGE